MITRLLDVAIRTLSVVFVVVGIFFMTRPGSMVRNELDAFRRQRTAARQVIAMWSEIVNNGERLYRSNKPISMVVYVDYLCDYCRALQDSLDLDLPRSTDFGVLYRHMPRRSVPLSEQAARAAICAAGQDRFPQLHRHLLASPLWARDVDWMQVADVIGVADITAFAGCLSSHSTTQRLAIDRMIADTIGIRMTPSVVTLEGGLVEGLAPAVKVLGQLTKRQWR